MQHQNQKYLVVSDEGVDLKSQQKTSCVRQRFPAERFIVMVCF